MKSQSRFHDPLDPQDTETETVGCRHTNPSICGNNMMPGTCAFAREDDRCLVPPRSWRKQFKRLLETSVDSEPGVTP